MKRLVLLLLLIVHHSSFSAVFVDKQSNNFEKKVEYYLSLDSENQYGKAKIVPVYRVPDEFLVKNAIHIKTKQLVEFDKNYSRIYLSSISTILSKYNVAKIRAPFLNCATASPLSTISIGIERIFEVYFSDEIDPYEVCKELNQLADVEYATPIFIRKTFDYIPNDPRINQQWYINNISLPRAWDITKGSKNVVIAIIDSGVDWNHPDLLANIWTNPKEVPGNNVDDDGNGKIDDVRGWDFVGNVTTQQLMSGIYREDNDPTNIQGFHGTHVAGLASAVTDNGVGIASSGFS
ncbi:MAG: S8 family serine peptidase, partial [Candidatus Kapaibacteriota bacterium]